jgi:hypothetical protein
MAGRKLASTSSNSGLVQISFAWARVTGIALLRDGVGAEPRAEAHGEAARRGK